MEVTRFDINIFPLAGVIEGKIPPFPSLAKSSNELNTIYSFPPGVNIASHAIIWYQARGFHA